MRAIDETRYKCDLVRPGHDDEYAYTYGPQALRSGLNGIVQAQVRGLGRMQGLEWIVIAHWQWLISMVIAVQQGKVSRRIPVLRKEWDPHRYQASR